MPRLELGSHGEYHEEGFNSEGMGAALRSATARVVSSKPIIKTGTSSTLSRIAGGTVPTGTGSQPLKQISTFIPTPATTQYVDSEGNKITKSQYDALVAAANQADVQSKVQATIQNTNVVPDSLAVASQVSKAVEQVQSQVVKTPEILPQVARAVVKMVIPQGGSMTTAEKVSAFKEQIASQLKQENAADQIEQTDVNKLTEVVKASDLDLSHPMAHYGLA